jgi:beta-phosphoglucomutase
MKSGSPILFDLDGVLIDSMPYHLQAFNEVLNDYGREVSANEIAGRTTREIFDSLFKPSDISDEKIDELVREKQTKSNLFLEKAGSRILRDELDTLIPELAVNHYLMICTAGKKTSVDLFFQLSHLSKFFHGTLDQSHVRYGKPNPEVYLLAAKTLNRAPSDCWVVEDSPAGCEAASRAGTKLMIFRNEISPVASRYPKSVEISCLTEINKHVKS